MRNDSHLDADLVPYVMDELEDSARARAERHLAHCAACQRDVSQMRLAVTALEPWTLQRPLPRPLYRRIVSHLPQRTRPYSPLWRAATLVLLLLAATAAGYALGARRPGTEQNTNANGLPMFVLLLEEPDWPPDQPLNRSGYGEWYNNMVAAGLQAGGEKLTDEPGWRVRRDGVVERPGPSTCSNLSGFFLVRARTYDDAIDWVRRGPHLQHGSVLVRQVE